MNQILSIYLVVLTLFSGVAGLLPESARLTGAVDYAVSGEKGRVELALDSELGHADVTVGDKTAAYYVARDGVASFGGGSRTDEGAYAARALIGQMARQNGGALVTGDPLSGLTADLATLEKHLAKLVGRVLAHPEWLRPEVSDDGLTYEALGADGWLRLLTSRYARVTLEGETLRTAALELLRDGLSDPELIDDISGLQLWSYLNALSGSPSRYSDPMSLMDALLSAYYSTGYEAWCYQVTLTLARGENEVSLTDEYRDDDVNHGRVVLRGSAGDAANGGLLLEYQMDSGYNGSWRRLQTGALSIRDREIRLTYSDQDKRDAKTWLASAEWDERGYRAELTGVGGSLYGSYRLRGYFDHDDGFRHDAVLTYDTAYGYTASLATLRQTVTPLEDGGFTHELFVSADTNDIRLRHQQTRADGLDNDISLTFFQGKRSLLTAELHQDQTAPEAQHIAFALRQYGLPVLSVAVKTGVSYADDGYTARVDAEADITDVGRYQARYETTRKAGAEDRLSATLRLLNDGNEFFLAQASETTAAGRRAWDASCAVMGVEVFRADAWADRTGAEATLHVMGESFAAKLGYQDGSRYELSALQNGAETFGALLTRETLIKGDGSEWRLLLRSGGAELARIELLHERFARKGDAPMDAAAMAAVSGAMDGYREGPIPSALRSLLEGASHHVRMIVTGASDDRVRLDLTLEMP